MSPETMTADFIGRAGNLKADEERIAEAKAAYVKELWLKRSEIDKALSALGVDPKRRPGRPNGSRSKKLPLTEPPQA